MTRIDFTQNMQIGMFDMNVIFLGVQGSGKGTQAKLLSEKFGWPHINVGEKFREHIAKQTKLGKQAEDFINKGKLVPDEFVFKMIEPALQNATRGFILDGFPRTEKQAYFLLDKFTIDICFNLKLPKSVAITRIQARRHCSSCHKDYNLLFNPPKQDGICDLCGGELVQRDDDKKEAIEKRIEEFHKTTKKVIPILKEKCRFVDLDADRPLEVIHKNVIEEIKK